jgi:hypothetical protein
MPDAAICWPRVADTGNASEFQAFNDLIQERHCLLTGAFGSIDGLNLPVQTSEDEDIENATYNGWLSEHFVSSVLVYAPDGKYLINEVFESRNSCKANLGTVIAAHLNVPGSWHDAHVAKPIYEKLLYQTPHTYYLVADTAFQRGTDQVQGYIQAPIKAGTRITGTREKVDQRLAFDRQLLSYRQTAEWGNRGLQGSFGWLRVPLEVGMTERHTNLLEICVRGYFLQAQKVGLNQI